MATVGEPVGATALAWLWLGEPNSPGVGIGCAITLVAVLLALGDGVQRQQFSGDRSL